MLVRLLSILRKCPMPRSLLLNQESEWKWKANVGRVVRNFHMRECLSLSGIFVLGFLWLLLVQSCPSTTFSEAGDVRIQAHECSQPYSSGGWTESNTSFGAITDSCPKHSAWSILHDPGQSLFIPFFSGWPKLRASAWVNHQYAVEFAVPLSFREDQ